jgi:hypothetical protein
MGSTFECLEINKTDVIGGHILEQVEIILNVDENVGDRQGGFRQKR